MGEPGLEGLVGPGSGAYAPRRRSHRERRTRTGSGRRSPGPWWKPPAPGPARLPPAATRRRPGRPRPPRWPGAGYGSCPCGSAAPSAATRPDEPPEPACRPSPSPPGTAPALPATSAPARSTRCAPRAPSRPGPGRAALSAPWLHQPYAQTGASALWTETDSEAGVAASAPARSCCTQRTRAGERTALGSGAAPRAAERGGACAAASRTVTKKRSASQPPTLTRRGASRREWRVRP